MKILNIRTDTSEAQLSLTEGETLLAERKWDAGRQLSDELLREIENILATASMGFSELGGINVFKGPGSFTGLRIGITVANTLSNSLSVPIVGSQSESWLSMGASGLEVGNNDEIVLPEYGAEANITTPRK